MTEPYENESMSIISTTKYGKNSAKMLHRIEKNLLLIIFPVGALTIFSLLDSLGAFRLLDLHIEGTVDTVISALSVAAVLITIPLFLFVYRSRKFLQRWERLFEENSLRSSIELCLTESSAENALRAIAECVEEIGESLQQYISGVEMSSILSNKTAQSYGFDVLLDQDSVNSQGASLRKVLFEYGSVIVKISERGDEENVESFISSLSKYVTTTRHSIGLAIFISDDISASAHVLAKHASGNSKISIILLIEKPTASLRPLS